MSRRTGSRRYRLEQLKNGSWRSVLGTKPTTAAGYFTRIVSAGAGAQFRVLDVATGAGVLRLQKVQPSSGRVMDAGAYLAAHPLHGAAFVS